MWPFHFYSRAMATFTGYPAYFIADWENWLGDWEHLEPMMQQPFSFLLFICCCWFLSSFSWYKVHLLLVSTSWLLQRFWWFNTITSTHTLPIPQITYTTCTDFAFTDIGWMCTSKPTWVDFPGCCWCVACACHCFSFNPYLGILYYG